MRILGLLFFLVCSFLGLNAQNEDSLFKNVLIDEQNKGSYPPCEPSIIINPKNPDQIVGAAILDKVYYSSDGGSTWSVSRLKSSLGVYGDPCLAVNKKGHFYYFHLSNPSGMGWSHPDILDRIVCQRSKNGNKWTDGTGIGKNGSKDQDKEWAVINPFNNEVYVTWTQFDKYDSKAEGDSTVILFSKSNKTVKKFSEPVRISQIAGNCADDDETTEGAVPAVGPNGEIYVAWAVNETIYFDKSLDGGNTWLDTDLIAGNIVGGWSQHIPGISRCNGMPVLKCDLSGGPFNGRLYINWTDQRNGIENTDVWMIYSDNHGESWSEPVRVNQDKGSAHQFFTWMDVDQMSGNIYSVFYDRRNSEGNLTEVYLAYSKDGGVSFDDVKISESPFEPKEHVFFGDYNNISAYNGVIRPIWTRFAENKLSIWTALVNEADLNLEN